MLEKRRSTPILPAFGSSLNLFSTLNATRGFIRYVGTIVTGPALTAVSLLARPKSV